MITQLLVYFALVSFCWCDQDFSGDQVLRIFPANKNDNQFLRKWLEDSVLELDIWQERQLPNASIDVHVPSNKLQVVKTVLNSNGIKFIVLIDDLAKNIDEESKSNQQNAFAYGFNYEKYNRYYVIQSQLKYLAKEYSSNVRLLPLGKSYEKRDMTGVKISTDFTKSKPIVWIDGGIHAREWISPATVMYFIKTVIEKIKNNNGERSINDYEFHILPVFNVDGYEYTHTGYRMWRKTRSPSSSSCFGVDPNRNWPTDFGRIGVSRYPCSDIYPGKRPFSEVEVQHVSNYLRRIKYRLKSYWTVHAFSQLVLTPYGYTKTLPGQNREIMRVGNIFARKLQESYGTKFRVGSPANILYPASGGSIDWVYKELSVVYSYGLELRDTGRYGFVLPATYIRPSGIETSKAWFAALEAMK